MSINITLLETPTTMRKQKDDRKPPKGGTQNSSLTVKVETEAGYVELDAHMLAGQVFYILDRSLAEILKENKNAIWGNLLKKKDGGRTESIREILPGGGPRTQIPGGADLHGR